jgi:hypothetical protein
MDHLTYSTRILCPFHGMLQVLALRGGVAESTDGYHWKLYVADERIISHTGLSEVRYGNWNAREGCSRSKVRGTAPSDLIERTGEHLLQALEACAHQVPFPPADHHEFWLLDGRDQPLALLESALSNPDQQNTVSPQWSPGAAAKLDFRSDHGDACSLTDLLQREAGLRPRGIWIERTPSGAGMTEGEPGFAAEAFPPLFIRSEWPDAANVALVRDFHAWQAPWLLQLHHLDRPTREHLEQAAWQRPSETSKLFRLFPEIYDQQSLTATRVKSRFLDGQSNLTPPEEPFYPFYNE